MSFLLAIVLAGASSVGVEFRLLDTGEPFRSLERTSLLYGSVEFRIRQPEGTEAHGLRVLGDSVTPSGNEVTLCESAGDSSCVVEFSHIARRRLRVEYELVTPGDGRRRISKSIATLHAHPGLEYSSEENVVVEHTRALGIPPDHVTRGIRFESTAGGGDRRRGRYHTDIKIEDLDVKISGVRGTKVVSLSPPDPEVPKLIPILFDVAPYLKKKKWHDGIEWEDSYVTRVAELRQGLSQAAAADVDVEYLVVSYGANDRLFGPFRLHHGRLDEPERLANDATLDALEQSLLRPPDTGVRGSDFGSIVHTLNDLYLRGYAGQVQLVWITDGWSAAGIPQFQPDLWPERVEQLNPEWSENEQAGVLAALDAGLGLQDAELSRFIASMPPDEPDRAGRMLRFLRELDRDATRTLHPHRVDTSPMMNCLFIPSDRSLRGDRFIEFRDFVERDWGGDFFRLLRLNRSITEELEEELNQRGQGTRVDSLAGLLRLTYEQLVHSGRIVLEVPNPRQNGARRAIKIKVRRADVRARLMPAYSASRPRDERLADFLGSPFKSLRMLAAYETRNHPFDDALQEMTRRRWEVETDPQVRAIVFESWISVQLQLLQTGKDRQRAYDALVSAGRQAGRLPLPALARDAAAAAEWYGPRGPSGATIHDVRPH
jgi:hypothetical protein